MSPVTHGGDEIAAAAEPSAFSCEPRELPPQPECRATGFEAARTFFGREKSLQAAGLSPLAGLACEP